MKTVVLQSHNPDRLNSWQGECCASVRDWAAKQGFAYRFEGDELFERVPDCLRRRFAAQPVVLSDLARLLWLRELLENGYDRALWCDADLLVFGELPLSAGGDRFGRECWVQRDRAGKREGERIRRYRKIHNAWMQFSDASPVLGFYIDRAAALLARAEPPLVAQFIGPKLLTAWHNIAPFDVEERVGMLSPLCMRELLGGSRGAPSRKNEGALHMLRAGHAQPLQALNLSASCEGREVDGVLHGPEDYRRLANGLRSGELARRLNGQNPR